MRIISNLLSYFLIFFTIQFSNSQNYQLIWSDEFQDEGKPDSEKWNFETGFVRNLEEQIYTKRRKNVRVKNGKLELTARKEKFRNKKFDPGVKNYRINTEYSAYTSASIHTKDKFEFRFGRVEVRAKLPRGNGVWPAIWMLGANFDEVEYPHAGEIDIMEFVGKNPHEIHATAHFPWDNNQGIKSIRGSRLIDDLTENFHVYSINWTPEKIEFLIDNSIFHTFLINEAGDHSNPFHKPFYLIINLALGGNWAGEIDPEIFPQKFIVDYVRIYKEIEE